ncbi:conserved hypothetical protein [Ricinus communis]|uniref:Uncharacterized protein n=1 Tax=Ricinus communis TaxID=3988 RepID=B9RRL1_RICCO|nr:conserved hypothetical protein [Ricinus communis]
MTTGYGVIVFVDSGNVYFTMPSRNKVNYTIGEAAAIIVARATSSTQVARQGAPPALQGAPPTITTQWTHLQTTAR